MEVRSRIVHWAQFLLRIWVAWNFAFYGGTKLLDPAGSAATAQMFGFPGWSWLLIGTIEVVAAVALLIRPAAGYAAATLTTIMIGAVAAHLWNGFSVRVPLTLLLFLAALLVIWTVQSRQQEADS